MWYSMYAPAKKDEHHHQITLFLENTMNCLCCLITQQSC